MYEAVLEMLKNLDETMQPNISKTTIKADAQQENMSIADMLRQTANEFLREKYLQGYEFHEDCKLYYNPVTGYYYDQDSTLFYHPSTKCYYYYDSQTNNYIYYARIPCEHNWTDKLAERKAVALFGESFTAGMSQDEVDIFECLNSLLKNVLQLIDRDNFDCDILDDEISAHIQEERMEYAPCVRLIEKNSGTLYVVTITGASIGTASKCDIQLSPKDCSKSGYGYVSAIISYNETDQKYFIMIDGNDSQVFHNKLSAVTNEATVIEHGDEWQFGEQEFLAHIHYGTNTCGLCEPGLLRSAHDVISPLNDNPASEKISKDALRRRTLRNMKKQYGIFDDEEGRYRCKYQKREQNLLANVNQNNDKSIYASCLAKPLPNELVQSINMTPSSSKMLDESNRGFNMLQRMGWKKGAGLGRKEDGTREPVISEIRPDRAGLGLKKELKFQVPKKQDSKQYLLEITRQRFQKAEILNIDDIQSDTT